MPGYLAIILHSHLPFVRHPDHERFLEESWLYEAINDCYLPLIANLESWEDDRLPVRLTLNLSPTLASMLGDSLLQQRFAQRLGQWIDLAEKEIFRTHWDLKLNTLAQFYFERFTRNQRLWQKWNGNLVNAFKHFEKTGLTEIITNSATHAVLPLLSNHPPSLRAQVLVARDYFMEVFGHSPNGFWLPECAYAPSVDVVLREAGIKWFVVEAHGLQMANPRPRYGIHAPIVTPAGLTAFARDVRSARQVWSRNEGYPGDPRYRDFYRDIGFDLDFDYVQPYLPSPNHRGFTGIKYHRITGNTNDKETYDRAEALEVIKSHAHHFVEERVKQVTELSEYMDRPPMMVSPYDAELFGHWWFEGPEFLDAVVRKVCSDPGTLKLVTPSDYLTLHPSNAFGQPAASTWGEGGHLGVWLNERNHELHSRLLHAQQQMSALLRRGVKRTALDERALRQAARELLLAQSSDWAFMIHAGNSAYPRERFETHLRNFEELNREIAAKTIIESNLKLLGARDNLFKHLQLSHFA